MKNSQENDCTAVKIEIIAIGKIKEDYLKVGIAEFYKRLRPYANVDLIECMEEKMPESPSAAEKAKVLAKEGEKLLAQVKEGSYIVALDLKGKRLSSEGLADFFSGKALAGQSKIAFLIGGAYGLSAVVKEKADMLLCFSDFTFTHQMIRLLLFEQIYRAFKIINNERYHN